ASSQSPDLLETGTLNHEGIVGAGAAMEFLASLAGAELPRRARLARVSHCLHERGSELLGQLWEGLRAIPAVEVYGPPAGTARTATLSFAVAGRDSQGVAAALADRGVFVSHGDFYATTAVRVLGHEHDGLVRAGCAAYTTAQEVERLLEGVRALA
ncbi:MAG: aminotransferase class V-fold PLP-dependent enzyme, partial [Steroidobacteraceae bacterium]